MQWLTTSPGIPTVCVVAEVATRAKIADLAVSALSEVIVWSPSVVWHPGSAILQVLARLGCSLLSGLSAP